MKTSERLKLINEITKALSVEDRSIIDLTLEQFNLPVSPRSKTESRNYVLARLKKAHDEVLQDLARHFGIAPETTWNNPTFWAEGRVRLFISHLAKEKRTATELRDELSRRGVSAFVAHNDISPSKEWQHEIEVGLNTCDALVALMVPGFHKSSWTDHEVGFVFGRGLPVIPVNMGEAPYGFLAKFQTCKYEDPESLAETIFRILLQDPRTTKKMSSALVHQFETSVSFASAAQNLKLLKKIRHWDERLIERLKAATKKNDQIRGSFDVPEGVARLIKKLRASM